jgi:hypothetical protein
LTQIKNIANILLISVKPGGPIKIYEWTHVIVQRDFNSLQQSERTKRDGDLKFQWNWELAVAGLNRPQADLNAFSGIAGPML